MNDFFCLRGEGAGSSLTRHLSFRPLWLLPQPESACCRKSWPSPCGDPLRSDVKHRPCPWPRRGFAWATAVGCPRRCPEPRQQQLPALSVLCGSCWQYKQCPQDEGGSRPHFSVRNPDRYKPNGIQRRCCQNSLKWLLCHSEVGCPFFSPFPSRVVWIIQLLSVTFREADKIMTLLSWVYCTLLGESIFVTIVKYIYFWYLALSLNGKKTFQEL